MTESLRITNHKQMKSRLNIAGRRPEERFKTMTTPTKTSEPIRCDDKITAYGTARSTVRDTPLSPDELQKIDSYWRASLYLSLCMLYLKENPLLLEPLKLAQIKPRLIGH